MTRSFLTTLVAASMLAACARPFLGRTTTGRDPNRLERYALLRAASDLQCEPEYLYVTSIGASGYRVEGCDRYVSYTCVQIPNGSVACNPSMTGPLHDTVVVATQPPIAIQQIAAAPQQPAAGAQPTGPEVDAVRGLIAQRAPSILACSGDAALAVDATWDATGALQVSLIGARAGTPEEACVRAALADARVEPAGAGGRVLHPVQRP